MALKYLQVQNLTLAGSGVTATATSVTVSSFKHLAAVGSSNVVTADLGDVCYATFEPGTAREELISFTGVTQNSDGTATLTGVTRNLKPYSPYDQYSATGLAHAGGSYLVVSDNPQLFDGLVDYIDGVAVAGAPNASTSAKGIVELGTSAEINAGTATGGTGAALAVTPDALAASNYATYLPSSSQKDALSGTVGTPSSTNDYVTAEGLTDLGTDQSQTTANATTAFGEADATTRRNRVAQSFVAGTGKWSMRGVRLRKAATTGTFTGTVTVSIQNDLAGNPSGSALVSKTFTNNEWRAVTNSSDVYVLFSTELATTPGTTYWIVAEASTADNSNCPNLATNSAGGYGSGTLKYRNGTDGWVTVTGIDLYFYTLDGLGGRGLKDAAYNTGTLRGALPVAVSRCFDSTAWTNPTGSIRALYHGLGKRPHEVSFSSKNGSSTALTTATGFVETVNGTYAYDWASYNEGTSGGSAEAGGAYTPSVTTVFAWGAGNTPPSGVTFVSADENVILLDGTSPGFITVVRA